MDYHFIFVRSYSNILKVRFKKDRRAKIRKAAKKKGITQQEFIRQQVDKGLPKS